MKRGYTMPVKSRDSNRRFLLGAAVVVVMLAVAYLLLGLKDLVGQAGEVLQPVTCEQGKFYLASDGTLEWCNCVLVGGVDSCARGSCEGAECKITKKLTINPSGGSVSVDNGALIADSSQENQRLFSWGVGEMHTLSVVGVPPAPNQGTQFLFDGWEPALPNSQLVVTRDDTYTPRWKTQHQLTITVNPADGGVVDVAAGWYDEGSSVTINAKPNANYEFGGWAVSPAAECSGTSACALTMDGPKTVTATFRTTVVSEPDFVFVPNELKLDVLDDGSYTASNQIRVSEQAGIGNIMFTIKNTGIKQGKLNYNFKISPDNQVNYWSGADGLWSSGQDIILDPGATKEINVKNVRFTSPGLYTIEYALASPDELSDTSKSNNKLAKTINVVKLPPMFTYSTYKKPQGASDYTAIRANVNNNYWTLDNAPCGYAPTTTKRFPCSFSIFPRTSTDTGDYKFDFKTKERSRCAGDKELFLTISNRGSTGDIALIHCPVPTKEDPQLPAYQDFSCPEMPFTTQIWAGDNVEISVQYRIDIKGCESPETVLLKEYKCTRPNDKGEQETGYVLLTQAPTVEDGVCEPVGDVGRIYPLKHAGTIPLYRLRCKNNLWGDVYSMDETGNIDFYGLDQPEKGNCNIVVDPVTSSNVIGYIHESTDVGLLRVPQPVPLSIYLCGDPQNAPYTYRFLSTGTAPDGCSLNTRTYTKIGYIISP